jgi:hypothetical protein
MNKIKSFFANMIPMIITVLLCSVILIISGINNNTQNNNQEMKLVLIELREWISTSTYNEEYVNKIDKVMSNQNK